MHLLILTTTTVGTLGLGAAYWIGRSLYAENRGGHFADWLSGHSIRR